MGRVVRIGGGCAVALALAGCGPRGDAGQQVAELLGSEDLAPSSLVEVGFDCAEGPMLPCVGPTGARLAAPQDGELEIQGLWTADALELLGALMRRPPDYYGQRSTGDWRAVWSGLFGSVGLRVEGLSWTLLFFDGSLGSMETGLARLDAPPQVDTMPERLVQLMGEEPFAIAGAEEGLLGWTAAGGLGGRQLYHRVVDGRLRLRIVDVGLRRAVTLDVGGYPERSSAYRQQPPAVVLHPRTATLWLTSDCSARRPRISRGPNCVDRYLADCTTRWAWLWRDPTQLAVVATEVGDVKLDQDTGDLRLASPYRYENNMVNGYCYVAPTIEATWRSVEWSADGPTAGEEWASASTGGEEAEESSAWELQTGEPNGPTVWCGDVSHFQTRPLYLVEGGERRQIAAAVSTHRQFGPWVVTRRYRRNGGCSPDPRVIDLRSEAGGPLDPEAERLLSRIEQPERLSLEDLAPGGMLSSCEEVGPLLHCADGLRDRQLEPVELPGLPPEPEELIDLGAGLFGFVDETSLRLFALPDEGTPAPVDLELEPTLRPSGGRPIRLPDGGLVRLLEDGRSEVEAAGDFVLWWDGEARAQLLDDLAKEPLVWDEQAELLIVQSDDQVVAYAQGSPPLRLGALPPGVGRVVRVGESRYVSGRSGLAWEAWNPGEPR